jgi:formate hydrogenlyase subunit 3/multisubunit Na+/H+ antiporter MnhD subunit
MARTSGGDQVYWFAGFRPARGIAIGIDFAAGPLSAGLAALAGLLVTAAMTFSWRYFQRVARVYWSMFGQALGHRAAVSHVFLALGLVTAAVGALYCFRERHIKRLLAFSTISHAGMFLTGFALLTPLGLAGEAA